MASSQQPHVSTIPSSNADPNSASSSSSSSYCWYCPPLISHIDTKKYPEIRKKMLLFDYPGGALIEKEMMGMMRWTCPLALFVVTPLDWRQARRKILNEADRSQVKIIPRIQKNLALGAACGAAMGAVEGLAKNWRLTEREVVQAAVSLREDVETDRWSRTCARMAGACVMPMVIYTNGPLHIRVAAGFASGVILSIPISATQLDFSFYYALQGTLRQRM